MANTKSKASTKGLEDLFLDGLKDIYYAEKKITKALPKMARAAESERASRRVRESTSPKPKRRSSVSNRYSNFWGNRRAARRARRSTASWKRG